MYIIIIIFPPFLYFLHSSPFCCLQKINPKMAEKNSDCCNSDTDDSDDINDDPLFKIVTINLKILKRSSLSCFFVFISSVPTVSDGFRRFPTTSDLQISYVNFL